MKVLELSRPSFLQLQPVKAEAEAQARRAAEGDQAEKDTPGE